MIELEREYERQLALHHKFMRSELEKLQKQQQATVVTLTKAIKSRQAKEFKLFKATCADSVKLLKSQTQGLTKVFWNYETCLS
jgi:hypothetical protein